MLRKRTRSPPKDQHMGLRGSEVVSDSQFHSDGLGQKHKTNSFFNVPGVFVGLSPKGLENDSVRSPTSPLDFRVFSKFGNPFRSPKSSSHEGHKKSWGCSKVGLSIIDSLIDETKSGKVLRSSDSKNILFGAQMGIKIPDVQCRFDSSEEPKSLPNNCEIFLSKQIIKPSNVHTLKSDIHSETGKTSLEAESFGNSNSYISNRRSNLSSGKFCLENGTSSVSLPRKMITGNPNVSSSLGTKLTSVPVLVGTHDGFIDSLSASEIELSEDYTCVKTHGPNPKTTHIYSDCILECHGSELTDLSKNEDQDIAVSPATNGPNPKTTHIYSDCILECHGSELTDLSRNEDQDIAVSPATNGSAIPISYPSNNFLSFCYSCKKKLEGEDIYMYRGEKAFCSWNCRSHEILVEEALEKTNNNSSENTLESNNCEELFENSMFIAP